MARWVAGIGAAGWLLGWLLLLTLPQRPDGDLTAIATFDARYPASALHRVREALWFNLAGAGLAWGVLHSALRTLRRVRPLPRLLLLVHLGLLVTWVGWAWNQTRGWQGELFLEPGVAVPLGVDRAPTVTFEGFRVPPAPAGPGRALALTLAVNGLPHDIAATTPYRGAGWTLTPIWFGATVHGERLTAPLFFGGDGTQQASLHTGESVPVMVEVATLAVRAEPPLALTATHHAIFLARFAPGEPLQRAGLLLLLGAGGGWLWARGRCIMNANAGRWTTPRRA